jgi:hypothetical protein
MTTAELADYKYVRLSDDDPTVPRVLELVMVETGPSLIVMGVTFVDLSIWQPHELARFLVIASLIVDEQAARDALQAVDA